MRHESSTLNSLNSDVIVDIAEDSYQNVSLESIPNEPSKCTILCKIFNIVIYLILEENGNCGDSNSSWIAESNASNWIQIYPPTLTTKLVYCLKYLVPTGEYQEVYDLFNVIYSVNIKLFLFLVFEPCI